MAATATEGRHRSLSILSNRTNSTWRADVLGPRRPRGAMVFTGPDSLRMHRQRVLNPDYTGEGEWSGERSGSAAYITRGAPSQPHPRPKSSYAGAYGWGAWGEVADRCASLDSGHQIKLNTFRKLLEDQASHKHQSAWYPAPPSTGSGRSSSGRQSGIQQRAQTGRLLSRQQR